MKPKPLNHDDWVSYTWCWILGDDFVPLVIKHGHWKSGNSPATFDKTGVVRLDQLPSAVANQVEEAKAKHGYESLYPWGNLYIYEGKIT